MSNIKIDKAKSNPMSWLYRYRIRSFLRNTIWLPPLVGMVVAIPFHRLIRMVDMALGWQTSVSTEGARALLGTLSASMFTFIVFVFSILLLSVQLASAQLTPRIIAFFFRNPVLKYSLSLFVFMFTYSLAVLFRIGDSVLPLSHGIAVFGSLLCIGNFLYMIDHVGKSLRPIILLNLVGSKGQHVIMHEYPRPASATEDFVTSVPPASEYRSLRIIASKRTGVLLAFDKAGLVELAQRADCQIELVPHVGDFVTTGDPLFRLLHGGAAITDHQLHQSVAIGPERTIEQDPGFAIRIIVDIATKALSPAVNDPTSAVHALDQIHRLLRLLGSRELDTGRVYDGNGQLRIIYRTPDWEDFISLAITEIRHYGKDSIQVIRRLRALLENLIETLPQQRIASLQKELDVLTRGLESNFTDPADRALAATGDSLGVGGSR